MLAVNQGNRPARLEVQDLHPRAAARIVKTAEHEEGDFFDSLAVHQKEVALRRVEESVHSAPAGGLSVGYWRLGRGNVERGNLQAEEANEEESEARAAADSAISERKQSLPGAQGRCKCQPTGRLMYSANVQVQSEIQVLFQHQVRKWLMEKGFAVARTLVLPANKQHLVKGLFCLCLEFRLSWYQTGTTMGFGRGSPNEGHGGEYLREMEAKMGRRSFSKASSHLLYQEEVE